MIVDGKAIAESVYARLPKKALRLGILVGVADPVIESFVKIKSRAAAKIDVTLVRHELPSGATTENAIATLRSLARDVDGVIVQLPLRKDIDVEAVLAEIPPEKDVDGISPIPRVYAPVAEAMREILIQEHVVIRDANAIVIGAGRLVGAPCARLLREMNARVRVLERGDSLDALRDADIVVSGAGNPAIIKPAMVKPGVVLIDAGTSESEGKVIGDADPACADVASIFTPVPGGVGPIAVAMIFKNLYALADQSN